MRLAIVPGRFAVCRLDPRAPVPAGIAESGFVSITRTSAERSVVCAEADAPEGARVERGWACLMLEGPIAFTTTGVLSALLAPLAEAKVGILALSTFETDYVLLKEAQLGVALAALKAAGHELGG